ncbi:MAG: UbiD family decarboxylase [Gammaproteobacteria bacterium]|nr:UbiD family decarboxylase [Gammaproteobacteria bacterium]
MNFRDLVSELESRGDLIRIRKAVNPEYELPALLAQAEARDKACWFEHIAGSDFPAVGGVLTSVQRWTLGLGLSTDRFAAPNSLEQYITEAVAAPVAAIVATTGPVCDVVINGNDVDTASLPAPLFFSGDSHRFISAGVGFAQDPETGKQNVGFYRLPILDRRLVSVSTGPTSDLRRIYNLHRERGTKLQIAVAIGVAPSLQIAAAADIPAGIADIDVAGALQRAPIELVKCQTSDIMVPADAEFVIEVTVDLETWVDNTMGEYGDQYGKTTSPVATIDAITHRRDALFHVIMAGMGREHNQLGSLMAYRMRATILERLHDRHPNVRDVFADMTPRRMGMRGQVAVSVDKTSDNQPDAIINDVFAMQIGRFPMSMLMQRVVIVDTDVDIRDHQDVEWAIASRTIHASQFSAHEDQTGRGASVIRFGFDATAPLAQRTVMRRPDIPSAEQYDLDRYLQD